MSTQWIELLADVDTEKGHVAGKTVEMDSAVADALIKTKQAKASTQPPAVKDEVNKIRQDLIKGLAGELLPELKTMLAPAAKGRRPGYMPIPDGSHIDVKGDNCLDDPSFGFKHIGEQVAAIKNWYTGKSQDDRLQVYRKAIDNGGVGVTTKGPTTYASEGLGADGGFLLAPNFIQEILRHTFTDESLMARCRTFTTNSNNLTIPKDETTPWGTSGVQVYWAAEASQYTPSKPKVGQDNLQLHKVTALVPVTDEQLQDSFMGLGQYVTELAGERIRWKVDEAIINGTGAGQPLGVIKSGALVTQAAEGSQTAGTINITNIAKMISRIPSESIKNLVWLVHPSAFPQLVILTNGNQSLYIAPGQVEDKAATMGRLTGIPLVISQHCQAVGTPGDIFLLDLSKYLVLTKGTGIEAAMSIHLYFDYSMSTFRFNFRVAGQPWLSSPITSAYGSYTMSPFVNLASR